MFSWSLILPQNWNQKYRSKCNAFTKATRQILQKALASSPERLVLRLATHVSKPEKLLLLKRNVDFSIPLNIGS